MAELTAALRRTIRRARQFGNIVVLNAHAGVAEELLDRGLIDAAWVMDNGGRVAWPLTSEGIAVRERLLDSPERRARYARASKVAALWLADVTGQSRAE